jgi:hypothetical protein
MEPWVQELVQEREREQEQKLQCELQETVFFTVKQRGLYLRYH